MPAHSELNQEFTRSINHRFWISATCYKCKKETWKGWYRKFISEWCYINLLSWMYVIMIFKWQMLFSPYLILNAKIFLSWNEKLFSYIKITPAWDASLAKSGSKASLFSDLSGFLNRKGSTIFKMQGHLLQASLKVPKYHMPKSQFCIKKTSI